MTEGEVWDEYMAREKAAAAKKEGQDPKKICQEVADLSGLPFDQVVKIVIDNTVMRAN